MIQNKLLYLLHYKKDYRPAEVELLMGDATKAKNELGWTPNVKFKELVEIMMKNDMNYDNI